MFRQVGAVFSFLTIIPAGSSNLQVVARHMYLFPVVGIAIGIIVGSAAWGLSFLLEPLVVGLLVTAALVLVTGLHHIDGLSDFADGLMVRGTRERKWQVMRDPSVGSAGIVSVVLYVGGMIIALSAIRGFDLFLAIIAAEIVAKFSMVLLTSFGPSAWEGSNSDFVKSMKDRRKLGIAAAITVLSLMLLQNNAAFAALAAGIVISLIILGISRRSFGGISGDILGATNEMTRLASLLVFASA
ncbi:adenosylcobinamide-GDP ribazoletransferase [Candidatus Nitrosotenuis cloacae]|uniref:adenosylcobinamide-GDP ribazoletransferase n=1 Tax=Candidatus Nitrosotenuis cloacae TaxID=1603555 RepID=UPI00227DE8B5|nr:adenosylcobinamide-GDP ribazoletransferase [Candidatus Nitrosotenuis cloacae]